MHQQLLAKLKQWQAGEIPPSLEWHELVPKEMTMVSVNGGGGGGGAGGTGEGGGLDKKEIERQGLMWEIFRSEQEYVKNLEGGLNVSQGNREGYPSGDVGGEDRGRERKRGLRWSLLGTFRTFRVSIYRFSCQDRHLCVSTVHFGSHTFRSELPGYQLTRSRLVLPCHPCCRWIGLCLPFSSRRILS